MLIFFIKVFKNIHYSKDSTKLDDRARFKIMPKSIEFSAGFSK